MPMKLERENGKFTPDLNNRTAIFLIPILSQYLPTTA